MKGQKKSYALRVDETHFEKLRIIADVAHRSVNSQIEFLIEQCVRQYEQEYGEVQVFLDE